MRVAVVTALTLLMHGAGAQDRPAETKVRLVVGGKSAIFYLPLSVTERLGYFKERGIYAEIADVQSGARALQSLIGVLMMAAGLALYFLSRTRAVPGLATPT